MEGDKERERDRERIISAIGTLPRCLESLEVSLWLVSESEARNSIQVSYMNGKMPITGLINTMSPLSTFTGSQSWESNQGVRCATCIFKLYV